MNTNESRASVKPCGLCFSSSVLLRGPDTAVHDAVVLLPVVSGGSHPHVCERVDTLLITGQQPTTSTCVPLSL